MQQSDWSWNGVYELEQWQRTNAPIEDSFLSTPQVRVSSTLNASTRRPFEVEAYVRNLRGWLETRLAQTTLNYL